MNVRKNTYRAMTKQRAVVLAGAAMMAASALTARGVVRTWDGGGVGGTDLGTAVNWSADTLPSANGDTGQFDGTVAGALSLVYSNTALGGAAGNTGLIFNVLGTQTSAI